MGQRLKMSKEKRILELPPKGEPKRGLHDRLHRARMAGLRSIDEKDRGGEENFNYKKKENNVCNRERKKNHEGMRHWSWENHSIPDVQFQRRGLNTSQTSKERGGERSAPQKV